MYIKGLETAASTRSVFIKDSVVVDKIRLKTFCTVNEQDREVYCCNYAQVINAKV